MAEPDVQRIVERVLARLEGHGVVSARAPRLPLGVFSTVDAAVDAAQHAHRRLVGMRLDERLEVALKDAHDDAAPALPPQALPTGA